MKQSTALEILKTGENVFLTGSAGSGKTYLLNQYIDYLRKKRVPVAITASTGIAATNLNGMTIHAWSGIGVHKEMSDKAIRSLANKSLLRKRVCQASVLIIDEVSMLHAKQFELINQVVQVLRKDDRFFGGMQLIVSGDFFQLPPINDKGEDVRDTFAFMSPTWEDANFWVCYLSEQYRQNDKIQSDPSNQTLSLNQILNQIRSGKVSPLAIKLLQQTQFHDLPPNSTQLYTHNADVNALNQKELARLDLPSCHYLASSGSYIQGDDGKALEMLQKSVRSPSHLTLRIGARVMFTKNINLDLGISNGTMGVVIDFVRFDGEKADWQIETSEDKPNSTIKCLQPKPSFQLGKSKLKTQDYHAHADQFSQDTYCPVVYLGGDRAVLVGFDTWTVEDENANVIASYSQIPLCLAWAITVHKSQGMTLTAAEIDLSKTFVVGQGYVALSRLTDLAGLKLLGMNKDSLKLHPLVFATDKVFKQQAQDCEKQIQALDKQDLIDKQNGFLTSVYGLFGQNGLPNDPDQTDTLPSSAYPQDPPTSRKNTHTPPNLNDLKNHNLKSKTELPEDKIDQLLEQQCSLSEIAEKLNLAKSSILYYLEQLKKHNYTQFAHHQYLRPEPEFLGQVGHIYLTLKIENDPENFDENGKIKLKPIVDQLALESSKADYSRVRLALLFLL